MWVCGGWLEVNELVGCALLLPCCGRNACQLRRSAAVWPLLLKKLEISILLVCFSGGSETSLCCGDPRRYPNASLLIREFFCFRPFAGPFGRPWRPRAPPGTSFGRPWGSLASLWGPLGGLWGHFGVPWEFLGHPSAPSWHPHGTPMHSRGVPMFCLSRVGLR
jgi:hypothetical protein